MYNVIESATDEIQAVSYQLADIAAGVEYAADKLISCSAERAEDIKSLLDEWLAELLNIEPYTQAQTEQRHELIETVSELVFTD